MLFSGGFNISDNIEEIIAERGYYIRKTEMFYLREKTPAMKENAVDGVFISTEPFVLPWNDDISNGDYINIISVSKGKVYYFGEDGSVIFPPTVKFKLMETDGKTFVWHCVSQTFKYRRSAIYPGKNYKHYLIIMTILVIMDVILFLIFLFTRVL